MEESKRGNPPSATLWPLFLLFVFMAISPVAPVTRPLPAFAYCAFMAGPPATIVVSIFVPIVVAIFVLILVDNDRDNDQVFLPPDT